MVWGISGGPVAPRIFVVECKRCRRHVPAGVEKFPVDNIVVCCPLCDEKRRYRPTEVYLGWVHEACIRQQVQRAEHYRLERQKKDRA